MTKKKVAVLILDGTGTLAIKRAKTTKFDREHIRGESLI